MINHNKDGTITFSFSSKFPELVIVMSSRKMGNLNIGKLPFNNAKKLLDKININTGQLVAMEQIHADKISLVNKSNGGSIIPGTDGLVTLNKNLFLGVKTADCVPIFFYDPRKKIIGIAHAGWKSTLSKIAAKIVKVMVKAGADIKNIHVLIGPHIHKCCYEVDKKRADLFNRAFNFDRMIEKRADKYYLDLGQVNKGVLIKEGILSPQIELETDCTSCKNKDYFSYRKDSSSIFGEMLSIIGIKE